MKLLYTLLLVLNTGLFAKIPAEVKKLQARFQMIKNDLADQAANPFLISSFMAPRFIEQKTWDQKKENQNFSPRFIYDPAPRTWDQWQHTERYLRDNMMKVKTAEDLKD